MQAQARRQQTQTACTAATSTRLLKSLINISIASILFSRLLLPEECFTSADMSSEVGSDSHAGRPLAIRALRASYSSEVDRILEVTKGAFEALERGYLRKLIFAIYLDESDPTNVLESYTFDISYDRVEGSGERHPVLSIVDQFQKVDLNKAGGDPGVKTVADLKRAVKNLVQHLVSSMDIANELPRSCYVGFQLYYTDDTPVEYEPPCFSAGDAEANKYRLNTHSESERPVTYSSQPLRTGYHSIGIRTASVAAFLHGRLKSTSGNKTLADEEDVLRREKDIHLEDARTRTTSWDVDRITQEDSTGGASDHANAVSMERRGSGMDIDVQYGGRYTQHKRLGSLLRSPEIADDTYTATQVVGTQSPALQHTQVAEDTPVPPRRSRRSAMRDNTETVDTMALTDLLLDRQARDSLQDIDVNTQDFIGPPKGRHSKEAEHAKCYCGLAATEDGLIRCDGPCGQTFHVWCLGFHTNDLRLHGEIKCFDCCIAEDPNAVLLTRPDVLANARLEFTDLVLFRRALQVIKLYQPGNWTAFKKHMHSAGNAAKPAWTRLEAEGFIALENPGAGDTDNALKKANKKQTKPSVKKKNPKHVLTAKVVGAEFDRYFSGTVDYKLLQLDESRLFPPAQVFNADSDEHPSGTNAKPEESQTQDESQYAAPEPSTSQTTRKRRPSSSTIANSPKRVKMSTYTGIGLYDL